MKTNEELNAFQIEGLTDDMIENVSGGSEDARSADACRIQAILKAIEKSALFPAPIKTLIMDTLKTLGVKAAHDLGIKLTRPETKAREFIDGILRM